MTARVCYGYILYYIVFCNDILERVNVTSKMLQDSQLNLNCSIVAVKSLEHLIESKRDCFDDYTSVEGRIKQARQNMLRHASDDATCA